MSQLCFTLQTTETVQNFNNHCSVDSNWQEVVFDMLNFENRWGRTPRPHPTNPPLGNSQIRPCPCHSIVGPRVSRRPFCFCFIYLFIYFFWGGELSPNQKKLRIIKFKKNIIHELINYIKLIHHPNVIKCHQMASNFQNFLGEAFQTPRRACATCRS